MRVRSRLVLSGAALSIAAAGVAVPWALASVGSTGVINACYNVKTGALRVIDPTAGGSCLKGESPLDWNRQGVPGANGNTVLSGVGPPVATIGTDGDFYLDTQATRLYGPKVSGIWPTTGTSLVGPAGVIGSVDQLQGTPCHNGAGTLGVNYADDGAVTFSCGGVLSVTPTYRSDAVTNIPFRVGSSPGGISCGNGATICSATVLAGPVTLHSAVPFAWTWSRASADSSTVPAWSGPVSPTWTGCTTTGTDSQTGDWTCSTSAPGAVTVDFTSLHDAFVNEIEPRTTTWENAVATCYASTGSLIGCSNGTNGIGPAYTGLSDPVVSITVGADGVITLTTEGGTTYVRTPTASNGSLIWTTSGSCQADQIC